MSKLKEQFSELRKNTPKRVQWLLLAAAFVVVLILLTLLLSGHKNDETGDTISADIAVQLSISPDMINWADVMLGEKKEQTIRVSANAPANIIAVHQDENINGLKITQTCVGMQKVNATSACNIIVSYAPTAPMPTAQVPIRVYWHDANKTEAMQKIDKIVMTLGATAPQPAEKPAPKPAVVATPVVETETKPESAPVVIQEEIKREIETIAPPVQFEEPVVVATQEESYVIPDGCSDFAFPGYGNSGRQIGWIKPSGGAYLFHPFSDKDCTKPTGTYNPDNGIITDNKGKKIGTDADHVGFSVISGGTIPQLSNAPVVRVENRAQQLDISELLDSEGMSSLDSIGMSGSIVKPAKETGVIPGTSAGKDQEVVASQPYDRSFVLRQYKPIPATIVSEVRADASVYEEGKPLPVRATVDRNVYSDDGRNIIIPTGTLMLGYVTGELPGPYKAIGRMQINWYQFIRPDGVEFNFTNENYQPFAGDAQGRVGVPGRGSTDYMEQFIMPMLTAVVPAAVNLIAPISDAFVNQIDLDNNTVVQSGTMRSSELAKNEIITAWNQVAQKLLVDMMDNTVPPFTIAAGTRITVYSPADLIVVCPDQGKSCNMVEYFDRSTRGAQKRFDYTKVQNVMSSDSNLSINRTGPDWVGQVRGFNLGSYCQSYKNGQLNLSDAEYKAISDMGYSYSTVLAYCQANQYEAKNNAKQQVYSASQQEAYQETYGTADDRNDEQTKAYNEQVLGLTYNDEGVIENPFNQPSTPVEEVPAQIMCDGNIAPDQNGCCPGEVYTDMGDQGFNCCPEGGGDCFPPII